MIGPLSVVSGAMTMLTLPQIVDESTRQQAVRALAVQARYTPVVARAIDLADSSPSARRKLEALILAMGRVLMAAREVG